VEVRHLWTTPASAAIGSALLGLSAAPLMAFAERIVSVSGIFADDAAVEQFFSFVYR
jgi:hypothetical protein